MPFIRGVMGALQIKLFHVENGVLHACVQFTIHRPIVNESETYNSCKHTHTHNFSYLPHLNIGLNILALFSCTVSPVETLIRYIFFRFFFSSRGLLVRSLIAYQRHRLCVCLISLPIAFTAYSMAVLVMCDDLCWLWTMNHPNSQWYTRGKCKRSQTANESNNEKAPFNQYEIEFKIGVWWKYFKCSDRNFYNLTS